MKALLVVLDLAALLARPAWAQWRPWASLNLGVASPTRTTTHHGVMTIGFACAPTYTGVCADAEDGFELNGFINVVDIGYSIAFGAQRPTSLFPRVGITAVFIDEHVANSSFVGFNAGIGLRHALTPHLAGRVDYTWRHYPGFVWPIVSVGLEGRR